MRTKFANLLKPALLIGAVLCCFSCTYIPHNELDGKILTDENGKKYKLEWQSGWGESWRFLEQVKDASGKDTTTRWQYVSKK
jgi:lysyl-tRNA synthetase class I